jgi:hypothetical protein
VSISARLKAVDRAFGGGAPLEGVILYLYHGLAPYRREPGEDCAVMGLAPGRETPWPDMPNRMFVLARDPADAVTPGWFTGEQRQLLLDCILPSLTPRQRAVVLKARKVLVFTRRDEAEEGRE